MFIVTFDGQANKKLIEEVGGEVKREFSHLPNILVAKIPLKSLEVIQSHPSVLYVEVDEEDEEFDLASADTYEDLVDMYSHELLKVGDFWDRGITGKGIKVAVMDGGCQPHVDLDIAGGFNAREPGKPYMVDASGHGTHVAGIIKSKKTGIAKDVELYIIKLSRQEGGGFTASAQIEAINWCLDNDIDIVNYSGGGSSYHEGRRMAFDQASKKGLIIVSSAGNSQGGNSPFVDTITYPARHESVITVGAINEDLKRRASSSCGSNLNFTAPGANILSTAVNSDSDISDKYEYRSGTSMAAPAVSALIALYKQVFQEYSKRELVDSMIYNVKSLGPRIEYGAGLPQPPYELYQRFIIPKELVGVDEGLVVYDSEMRKIGVLEKAHNISVERRVNELWVASFSLIESDPKNNLCNHFNYIEITSPSGRYMGLYRIVPTKTKRNARERSITYRCEHVLSTLMDDVIDGQLILTHTNTTDNLQEILNLQTVKRWELGRVDFKRHFNYKFENENGLLAPVLEIPKGFNEPYEFTFDTTVYPWKLNLIVPSNRVTSEIRWGKDMISFEEVSDPSNIVNYIIPKGAGEGVNQLTIKGVNNGVNYLKDDESIKRWGTHKYIWIDRRYEDPQSLKDSGQAKLDQWKDPQISFECSAADLSIKPEYSHDRRLLNGVTRIFVEDREYDARIIAEKIPDLNREWDVDYEINNKIDDISITQADLERKQQVNDAYSQGATNILNFTYQDNADSNIPATIPFYIDDDVVNVNTCELTFRTKPFRAYSRATEGGGALVKSTGGGGGTVKSTSSGGGTTRSTTSGGGTTKTSSAGGDHRHKMFTSVGQGDGGDPGQATFLHANGNKRISVMATTPLLEEFYTEGSSGNHHHSITLTPHNHEFTVPAHTHNIELPNHTHEIELPNHTHNVKHEIIELNSLPSSVTIKVDGNTVPHSRIEGNRIELTDYIAKDSDGRIKRGRHEVTILPNGLARIEADLIMRVFIQSHLGGVY